MKMIYEITPTSAPPKGGLDAAAGELRAQRRGLLTIGPLRSRPIELSYNYHSNYAVVIFFCY